MYQFHITVHRMRSGVNTAAAISIGGRQVTPLENVCGEALSATFEKAAEALERLPRLFIEPDGSFVWVGDAAGVSWQVDGQLTDRGDCLQYAEVKGKCPPDRFDELLKALGWPQSPLAFHVVQHGLWLNEQDFRKLASVV